MIHSLDIFIHPLGCSAGVPPKSGDDTKSYSPSQDIPIIFSPVSSYNRDTRADLNVDALLHHNFYKIQPVRNPW